MAVNTCCLTIVMLETVCLMIARDRFIRRVHQQYQTHLKPKKPQMVKLQPQHMLHLETSTTEYEARDTLLLPKLTCNCYEEMLGYKSRKETAEVVAIMEAIDTLRSGRMILRDQEQYGCFCFNRTRPYYNIYEEQLWRIRRQRKTNT